MRNALLRLIALACACATVPSSQATPVWEPAKTWVFAVGVIQFDNPDLTSWPDEGRADADMIEALRKRGVPEDHILFLKNREGTLQNITHQFGPFLKQAGPEDTLIFYYAGHGSRNYREAARPCTFVTYDTASSWTVSSIFETVNRDFHGQQVLYTADCCHSGTLVVEAAKQPERAAALTSAHVSSTSTGNWTFTRCLTMMYEGNPMLDRSGDGQITFTEAAQFAVNEMAVLEGQHSANGTSGGFPSDMVISRATGPHSPRMGEFIEGESAGKWWKARVLKERDGEVYVTWPGWKRSYDEWLPLSRTRPYHPKTYKVGDLVQTEWRKQWYDARVIKVELGLHLVHYEGFAESDDEWVRYDRLRPRE